MCPIRHTFEQGVSDFRYSINLSKCALLKTVKFETNVFNHFNASAFEKLISLTYKSKINVILYEEC